MTLKVLLILPLLYDPFIGKDKTKHFGTSCIIAEVAYIKTNDTKKAFLFTAALGVAKEIYDLKVKKTKFSKKDLFWDILGATTGIMLEKYFK